jgi:hypothetical protein
MFTVQHFFIGEDVEGSDKKRNSGVDQLASLSTQSSLPACDIKLDEEDEEGDSESDEDQSAQWWVKAQRKDSGFHSPDEVAVVHLPTSVENSGTRLHDPENAFAFEASCTDTRTQKMRQRSADWHALIQKKSTTSTPSSKMLNLILAFVGG